ncbi:zinc ribbon domain-containing protein [Clostridium kluyveri]|uniref:Cas12f1-like TNB domain-containing protein n=1 Tax=Clostridium kluyveri TaxID=1534 RepID=A0A1L5F9X4_CLOKL|nr:zinc ribbon domain-containing protein [Clostridium kluyveri]APM39804.1 hypothetical protein BS101_14200 [Clostridium kluyveri]UZQ50034.1 transposase [Clostridium kluyveri]
MIEDNKIIVIGNLSQEKMIKNSEIKKFNRSIKENWGLGKFKTYLTYKAKLHDVEIVKINEAYTSKICSNCGNQVILRFRWSLLVRNAFLHLNFRRTYPEA